MPTVDVSELTGLSVIALAREHEINPLSCEKLIDKAAITRFSSALLDKLADGYIKGRHGWWSDDCSEESLNSLLRAHMMKGDPLDVAALAMMLYLRKETIK